MKLIRFDFRFSLFGLFALGYLLLATQVYAQSYCAKEYSSLSVSERQRLSVLALQLRGITLNPWKTRDIPVIIHPSLGSDYQPLIESALRDVSRISGSATAGADEDRSGFKFYLCPPEVVASNGSIKGYLSIVTDKIIRPNCPNGTSCAKVGFYPAINRSKPFETSTMIGLGRLGGAPASKGTIIHEILHALGARHAHQHPNNDRGRSVASTRSTGNNCKILTEGRFSPQYDPASIMHYQLGRWSTCGLKPLGCEVTSRPGFVLLKECDVEEVVKEGNVCGYSSAAGNPETSCFKPPTTADGPVVDGSRNYNPTTFGQEFCVSVLDQVWLYGVSVGLQSSDSYKPHLSECRPI